MYFMTCQEDWLDRSHCKLLSLPKELLLEIITLVGLESTPLIPTSLLELSSCSKYLYHLVHKDPWRLHILWPQAFHSRFDTSAIYRRRIHHSIHWQRTLERRCKALYRCRSFSDTKDTNILDTIDWQVIWDMLTEHDQLNVSHLLAFGVPLAAGTLFQLDGFRDRAAYPVVLPILSLLVNYDFSMTRFFKRESGLSVVTGEISQFAYNSEEDALITQHTPFIYDDQPRQPTRFYPAQDPLASAFHLFFATLFAHQRNLYQAIPGCIPIPLFPLRSEQFDVEFARRSQRDAFFQGGIRPTRYVSEAHAIEGDWMGYYTFRDSDDNNSLEDWLDGPMRITLKIVPLDSPAPDLFPSPLTRFEGSGIDSSGLFLVSGLIDDSEEGQITWEKNYVQSGETWEYSGRFLWPVGLCGRWGDEEYGGPWWMWKTNQVNTLPPIASAK